MSCVLYGRLTQENRVVAARRSRAISFLELLSHATVVLTLTSVTCNCYMLAYTLRYKRTRNATHYSRVAHVPTLSSDPFFRFLRQEEGAASRVRTPGMWYRFSFTSTFLRYLLLSQTVHSTIEITDYLHLKM